MSGKETVQVRTKQVPFHGVIGAEVFVVFGGMLPVTGDATRVQGARGSLRLGCWI